MDEEWIQERMSYLSPMLQDMTSYVLQYFEQGYNLLDVAEAMTLMISSLVIRSTKNVDLLREETFKVFDAYSQFSENSEVVSKVSVAAELMGVSDFLAFLFSSLSFAVENDESTQPSDDEELASSDVH